MTNSRAPPPCRGGACRGLRRIIGLDRPYRIVGGDDVWPNVGFFSHAMRHPLTCAASTNDVAPSVPGGMKRAPPPTTRKTQQAAHSAPNRIGHESHPAQAPPFLQGLKQTRTGDEPELAIEPSSVGPSPSSKGGAKQEGPSNEEPRPFCAHPSPRVRRTNRRTNETGFSFCFFFFIFWIPNKSPSTRARATRARA